MNVYHIYIVFDIYYYGTKDNLRRQYKKTQIDKTEMNQSVIVILPYMLAGCKTWSPWIGILANNSYQIKFFFHYAV